MAAYLSAIRSAQGLLISRKRESVFRGVWERVKDDYPELKAPESREIPAEEIESSIQSLLDKELDAIFAPMLTAIGEISLYGSEAAYEASMTLLRVYPKGNESDLELALGNFIAVCRRELGLPVLTQR